MLPYRYLGVPLSDKTVKKEDCCLNHLSRNYICEMENHRYILWESCGFFRGIYMIRFYFGSSHVGFLTEHSSLQREYSTVFL